MEDFVEGEVIVFIIYLIGVNGFGRKNIKEDVSFLVWVMVVIFLFKILLRIFIFFRVKFNVCLLFYFSVLFLLFLRFLF